MSTEKSYGGASIEAGKKSVSNANQLASVKESRKTENNINDNLSKQDIASYKKAGEIMRKVREYAKSIIKKDENLLDIAEKIEAKIIELGGAPAFPVNLSINEIAAHYTPAYNDEEKARDLLKVDIGVAVDGCIADSAFSLDLAGGKYKQLIEAAEASLRAALNYVKNNKEIRINEIGKRIHEEITKKGFSPVRNLSGHELGKNMIHAGITIPNYDNGNSSILEKGAYAIEPFATSGIGLVYDGKMSEIYRFEERKGVRDKLAREIMDFILEEYSSLPFCSRWIVKKFGTRGLLALSFLEQAGIIYRYPQLVEKSQKEVSQAEHTFIIDEKAEITSD